MDKKVVFYTMPMFDGRDIKKAKRAGTAVKAVIESGQTVFAEVRIDDHKRIWTDFYVLNPAGI